MVGFVSKLPFGPSLRGQNMDGVKGRNNSVVICFDFLVQFDDVSRELTSCKAFGDEYVI